MERKIVHVVGTGTIGEPLIGLLCDFRDQLGIDDITFHKNSPLKSDRAKVISLLDRGARLVVDEGQNDDFKALEMDPNFETEEAIKRASVVIDCTPKGIGHRNKEQYYHKFENDVKGFIAQGSENGFGKNMPGESMIPRWNPETNLSRWFRAIRIICRALQIPWRWAKVRTICRMENLFASGVPMISVRPVDLFLHLR